MHIKYDPISHICVSYNIHTLKINTVTKIEPMCITSDFHQPGFTQHMNIISLPDDEALEMFSHP